MWNSYAGHFLLSTPSLILMVWMFKMHIYKCLKQMLISSIKYERNFVFCFSRQVFSA